MAIAKRGAAGTLCAAVLVVAIGCGSLASDRELLDRFTAHRAELNQLVQMFQHDKGLGRVGSDFTRPDDPSTVSVTAARIADYRRLCRAVDAPDCIEGYDNRFGPEWAEDKDPIWIHASSVGLSIGGADKGYCYSAKPKDPIVSTFDDLSVRGKGTWLRHIEGNWYLYLDLR